MSLITKMRKQTAVYWPRGSNATGGVDFDDYGKPVFDTAVEITCRWEDVAKEFIAPNGQKELSRSIVYVDRDMKVGEMLFLGELTDLTDATDPWANEGAWAIKQFDKLPTLKATEFLRTAYL